jgi:hypothetical protein
MDNLRKPNNWSEEERRNVVGAFQILLGMDKRINPHLYKKRRNPPKSLGNVPDKQVDNRSSIMSENS